MEKKKTSIDTLDLLKPDLTCSICWELFQDPVSLECGHNFCTQCITCHWDSGVAGSQPPCCPECRKSYDKKHLVPDARLRSILENVESLQQRASLNQESHDVCRTQAKPLQLVQANSRTDFSLCLNVLTQCLNHPQAKNNPVCLISVMGEQRTGKSFFLNYLIRGMRGLESKDLQWITRERDLQGFQFAPGDKSITKGVWIWSQPFILEKDGKKVAVFLVDTEGTISLEQDKETNAKLVALSMLLSSHQILNVSRMLKETDLEYLEMFLHIAEEIGEYFKMAPIQHLDLLVRDWFFPPTFGKEAGQIHINKVMQRISDRYPRIQKILDDKLVSCCLLPFPGKKVAGSCNGNPEDFPGSQIFTSSDMDPEFYQHLHDFITDVCNSATQHVKRDSDGHSFTGEKLAENITKLFNLLKEEEFGFSLSLDSLATQLHDMRMVEAARKELEDFVKDQDFSTKSMFASLKTAPKKMCTLISSKKNEILNGLKETLKSPKKCQIVKNFEEDCQKMVKDFQDSYKKRFWGQSTALGGLVGGGILAVAGGLVGVGVAATVLTLEAAAVATGATVGATVVGSGIGAGIGAAVGKAKGEEKVPKEEEENLLDSDDE